MPLHLLHHKSYHVYSAENIARVRRDEADAEAREAAEDARMQAADAEARMKLLRERARQGDSTVAAEKISEHGTEEPTTRHMKARDCRPRPPLEGGILGTDGHINLFPTPTGPRGGNPEREREKKEEKEREEGAMGKVVGERRPWYSSVDLVSGRQREKEQNGRKTEWEGKREERRKEAGDPLQAIRRGVRGVKEARSDREEWKRRREREVGEVEVRDWQGGRDEEAHRNDRGDRSERDGDRKRRRRRSRSRNRSCSPSRHGRAHKGHSHSHSHSDPRSRSHNHKHHRDSPDHHHHHHHHHSRSHRRRSRSKSPNPTLESLRKEKSARESAERQKAASLLAKARADSEPGWKPVPGGRYSSQFGNLPK